MGATRTVLTRKALTRKVLKALGINIGLSVGPDSLPQELGIENIALDRVVRFYFFYFFKILTLSNLST